MNKQNADTNNSVKKNMDVKINVGSQSKNILFIIIGIVLILVMFVGGFFLLNNFYNEKKQIENVYNKIQEGKTSGLEYKVKELVDKYPSDKTYLVAGAYYIQMGKWNDAINYFELVKDKDLNTNVALLSAYTYNNELSTASDLADKLRPDIEKIEVGSFDGYTAYYYYSITGYINEQYFIEYKNIDFLKDAMVEYEKAISFYQDTTLSNKINQLKSEYEKFGGNK